LYICTCVNNVIKGRVAILFFVHDIKTEKCTQ
jgi:hypothetical protein